MELPSRILVHRRQPDGTFRLYPDESVRIPRRYRKLQSRTWTRPVAALLPRNDPGSYTHISPARACNARNVCRRRRRIAYHKIHDPLLYSIRSFHMGERSQGCFIYLPLPAVDDGPIEFAGFGMALWFCRPEMKLIAATEKQLAEKKDNEKDPPSPISQ